MPTAHRPFPVTVRAVPAGSVALGLTILVCAAAASAAAPTPADALALKPRQQGVDYSQPTEAEAKQATIKQEKEGGVSALVVRGPSGEVLRAFADTDGNRVVDRWSYYKDGLEIYREIDADKDTKPEEYRWLGGAGSRWGVDANGDGVIDAWKTLSAEEATAEIVNAIRDRDAAAFARLMPTKEDLQAAGFEGDVPLEAPLLAVDLGLGAEPGLGVAPRVERGSVVFEGDIYGLGDTVNRQVAGHDDVVTFGSG